MDSWSDIIGMLKQMVVVLKYMFEEDVSGIVFFEGIV